jgi:hypothetical protein
MKLPVKSVAWVLPFFLTACFHKTNHTQTEPLAPPIVDAPPPTPEPSPTNLPPPVITVPNQAPPPSTGTEPQTPPKPPVKHRKSTPKPAPQSNQGVSAIGQLSSGDAGDTVQQTIDSIAGTERGLNAITRTLSTQEEKTAEQIREFIKQARAALASGDVDGAHTLAIKARVLLAELTQ